MPDIKLSGARHTGVSGLYHRPPRSVRNRNRKTGKPPGGFGKDVQARIFRTVRPWSLPMFFFALFTGCGLIHDRL